MPRILISTTLFVFTSIAAFGGTYYVATTGNDSGGNGSSKAPWATLAWAVDHVPDDGSTIVVNAGIYSGRVRLYRKFTKKATLQGSPSYQTIIQSSEAAPVITVYGGANFEFRGFQVRRPNASATGVILVHVQASGGGASDITFRDNIFHDSYNNDLLKINNGATRVHVLGNLFYNQSGYDEHIDLNGVTDIEVANNVFFNDFEGSGRRNGNNTGSFIVIKNSGGLPANARFTVARNVFLNWQGSAGASAITVGEDGTANYEAEDVLIENNLVIGNSSNTISSAFTVQGSRRIKFRANTVTGNLPARSYAMNVFRSGSNPKNEDISFYNNIWSDPTATMGKFSRGNPLDTLRAVLKNNLYWNGGVALTADADAFNIGMDLTKIMGNPLHIDQDNVILPRFAGARFVSGNKTVRAEFRRLAEAYGRLGEGSPAIGRALAAETPEVDILGRLRGPTNDIGCWNSTVIRPPNAVVPVLQGLTGANGATLKAGALAELRGLNLAAVVDALPAPFPTVLDGTMVMLDGIPLPITYLSPTRVQFVMPATLPRNREMVVELNGIWSNPLPF